MERKRTKFSREPKASGSVPSKSKRSISDLIACNASTFTAAIDSPPNLEASSASKFCFNSSRSFFSRASRSTSPTISALVRLPIGSDSASASSSIHLSASLRTKTTGLSIGLSRRRLAWKTVLCSPSFRGPRQISHVTATRTATTTTIGVNDARVGPTTGASILGGETASAAGTGMTSIGISAVRISRYCGLGGDSS